MNVSTEQKYFGTDGIRGKVGEALINPEFVLKLGWAAGIVLGQGEGGKILIGKDTRVSGYMFESALEAGLAAAGMDTHLLGPMPTPAVAYLTRTLRAKAGIVISASHNSFEDNGIKFFSTVGVKLPDEIELAIEAQLAQPLTVVSSAQLGRAARIVDAPGRYIEFCKSTFPFGMSLAGMKVVVDCAQGATYRIAPSVFSELGATVTKLGIHPNGLNINAHCGSTKPEALQKAVLSEKADVGIAFDGDGDRVLMVDHEGELVDGDELLYIMVCEAAKKHMLPKGIVGTQMSNLGFEQALRQMGVDFKRANVGDRYVIEELNKMGWLLGGEPSGHIVHLGLTTTGDGIISALQVLRAMSDEGKSLHELKRGMQKYPQILVNVPITKRVVIADEPTLQAAVHAVEQKLGNKGRVLLRASGTEPVIRVMVEGEDKEQVAATAQELTAAVERVAT
ncbi:MAG: phosphoglucosamine mutase [Gammaproteobacteria bacterium]